MAKLKLSFACGLYDRMQPLYTGEVKVEGIDLNFIAIDQPRPIFDRMSGGEEFDVAEYSSSEFVQRFAAGQCPFVAIPVFPSRAFRHGFIAVHRKAAIRSPKDLEGKRVGVPLLTMTAAIYINGLLQHEYGVDLRRIHWVQGAMNTGRRTRQPQRASPARCRLDRAQQIGQIDERPDRGTRRRRHAGHQPARGDPHQPRHRAAVSELCGAREGVLPAHQDLSDHAPGRHPQAGLREVSVRGDQPVHRVLQVQERSRWRRCSIFGRCAT